MESGLWGSWLYALSLVKVHEDRNRTMNLFHININININIDIDINKY